MCKIVPDDVWSLEFNLNRLAFPLPLLLLSHFQRCDVYKITLSASERLRLKTKIQTSIEPPVN